MYFLEKYQTTWPEEGHIALFWLGQAGFVIRNSKRETLVLDAYLSDLSERLDGNKRIMMPVLEAKDVKADVILISHCHTDHLDIDSLPEMMEDAKVVYCDRASKEMCQKAWAQEETAKLRNMDRDPAGEVQEKEKINKLQQIDVGTSYQYGDFTIEPVFCDHGDAAVDALGFLIQTEGITLYFPGDTSFQSDRMRYATDKELDILVVPINGEYGNMNERDAAMLAGQAKAKLTIPSHFWTFTRHKGNPYEFELEMAAHYPAQKAYTMSQGEVIIYPEMMSRLL